MVTMDPTIRSWVILIAAVTVQVLLARWQIGAGMDYARLYESRTGRLVLLHGVEPIRILLSAGLREEGFYRVQEDPGLEAMRVRYVNRRNVFIVATLIDWLLLYALLNVVR
jgi:hypothetical protein